MWTLKKNCLSNMSKNQLFKKIPTLELIISVINCFGLETLTDHRSFSRKDLIKLETVKQINYLKPILERYYLPCKARNYLSDLNEKNVITVLRQILKTRDYTINSREKYMKGDKFIIYNICPINHKNYISVINPTMDIVKKKIIIDFN